MLTHYIHSLHVHSFQFLIQFLYYFICHFLQNIFLQSENPKLNLRQTFPSPPPSLLHLFTFIHFSPLLSIFSSANSFSPWTVCLFRFMSSASTSADSPNPYSWPKTAIEETPFLWPFRRQFGTSSVASVSNCGISVPQACSWQTFLGPYLQTLAASTSLGKSNDLYQAVSARRHHCCDLDIGRFV